MNFRAATIGIDGSVVGAVSHHGFIVAEVAPGDHKISAWVRGFFQEFVIGIAVEAGKTYYMRVSQRAERLLYPMIPVVGGFVMLADTKGEFQIEPMPAKAFRIVRFKHALRRSRRTRFIKSTPPFVLRWT
jgi:hypothetical protein